MHCFHHVIILLILYHRLLGAVHPSKILRNKRYLVYPPSGNVAVSKVQLILGVGLPMEVDVSMIIGYVMKFNYALPTNASYLMNPYVRYDRSIREDIQSNRNDDEPINDEGIAVQNACVMSRWEVYDTVQMALQSGKTCLLKAICHAAAIPFNMDHGLTSQLLHIFLTPSTTSEPLRTNFDQEYLAAEMLGRQNLENCEGLFPECTGSLLEYFTVI